MKKIFLIPITIVLIIFTFFTGVLINKNFLIFSANFLKNYFKTDLYRENISLKFENESLKAQLQKTVDFEANRDSIYISAKIFSTYPFNIKNSLLVDKGLKQGIQKNMTVLVSEGILLGRVEEASDNSSIIQTIFDSNWKMPVKIGEEKTNGLFEGGNDPKITLIEKPVKSGDVVFTASKDFLLNLKIGEIREIKQDNSGIFKEAFVDIPYSVNELNEVYLK
ncbi:MAG: rod shape-determining protein MreC [Patescibacteria group bacterium]|nr:rod shape-determining protein MreC [Patescibacteria group bacterium]